MQTRLVVVLGRGWASLAILAALAVAPVGCDSGPKEGAQAPVTPEIKQSNENMENFMKNQQTKKK